MKKTLPLILLMMFASASLPAAAMAAQKSLTYDELADEAREQTEEKTAKEIKDLLKKSPEKYVLVDVREADEFLSGYIEGAISIPRGILEKTITDHVKPGGESKTILIYCNSGHRSALASLSLKKMGYKVISMEDGYKGWIKAGFKMKNKYGDFVPDLANKAK